MPTRILILQGHPDPAGGHLNHALAEAYAEGARAAGHEVRVVEVASLDVPLVRHKKEWDTAPVPEGLREAQQAIAWAEHLVLFFPLWLGDMPAALKAFLEQVLRPGFAVAPVPGPTMYRKLLGGRSARVVVTMGMPALVYRWVFRAHSLKALERNILGFVGIAPVRETLVGRVGELDAAGVEGWRRTLRALGRRAA